jgi:hypothetical protein
MAMFIEKHIWLLLNEIVENSRFAARAQMSLCEKDSLLSLLTIWLISIEKVKVVFTETAVSVIRDVIEILNVWLPFYIRADFWTQL